MQSVTLGQLLPALTTPQQQQQLLSSPSVNRSPGNQTQVCQYKSDGPVYGQCLRAMLNDCNAICDLQSLLQVPGGSRVSRFGGGLTDELSLND